MAKKPKQLTTEELTKVAQRLIEAPAENVEAIKTELITGFYGKPVDKLRKRLTTGLR